MFRRGLLAACCLLGLLGGASAQTSETRSQLLIQNNSTIFPNVSGAITPQSLNALTSNMIASSATQADVNVFLQMPIFPCTGLVQGAGAGPTFCSPTLPIGLTIQSPTITGAVFSGLSGPLLGNGSGAVTAGTISGNTHAFLTADGALVSGHCPQIDGSGGLIDSGGACGGGGGGSGTVATGLANNLGFYAVGGNTISPLTTTANSILATSAGGVPGLTTTIPAGVGGAFATGGNENTIWTSANTGFENNFQAQNSGTSSNGSTRAIFTAALSGCSFCNSYLYANGGATPTGYVQSDTGLTGGLTISAQVGPVTLSTATSVVVPGGEVTLGIAGSETGNLVFENLTSGYVALQPATGALGTSLAILPANSGTITEDNINNIFSAPQTISAGAAGGELIASFLDPTLGGGHPVYLGLGITGTGSNNLVQLVYNFVSLGSNSNSFSLSFANGATVLTANANGLVTAPYSFATPGLPGLSNNVAGAGSPGLDMSGCSTLVTCGWEIYSAPTNYAASYTPLQVLRIAPASGGSTVYDVAYFQTSTGLHETGSEYGVSSITYVGTLASTGLLGIGVSASAIKILNGQAPGTSMAWAMGLYVQAIDQTNVVNPTSPIQAAEIDVYSNAGSGTDSNGQRIGVAINGGTNGSPDPGVHISRLLALGINNQVTVDNGITFGTSSGGNFVNGIVATAVNFTGCVLCMPGFTTDNSGDLTISASGAFALSVAGVSNLYGGAVFGGNPAPTDTTNQISIGGTSTGNASGCGGGSATACMQIRVNGFLRYVPFY
jgi:hypothetical protein